MTTANDLDPAVVGNVLLALPAVASRSGHRTPRGTLYYLAVDENTRPEVVFVRDVVSGMSTSELAKRWYSDDDVMVQNASLDVAAS
jgi:hypothetical protein